MSESRHHNLPSSYLNTSEIIDDVKNKIEICIQEYMNLEETLTYLQDKHKINHNVTKLILEQLQRDSPEFFNDYHLKLEMIRHIKMFNGLLAKQVALMIESGELDISNASSAILKFLFQDPEGTLVLDKIATTPAYYPEVSPSSLALADNTNGPTVNQLQIPNNQQTQWSSSNIFTDNYLGAPTYTPAATDQFFTSNDLPYNYLAASTAAPATTTQWFPSNNLAYIGDHVAQAATMPQDPFTFGFGGNIGYNGQNFTVTDIAQLVMPSENHIPQLQLQNFPQAEQQTLQYEVNNNGIRHGGNNLGVVQSENRLQDQYGQYQQPQLELQQHFLLEGTQPLQYGVSNSELQYGGNNNNWLQGVRHDFEVFNNPNSGDRTLTMPQIQHDLQSQQG